MKLVQEYNFKFSFDHDESEIRKYLLWIVEELWVIFALAFESS